MNEQQAKPGNGHHLVEVIVDGVPRKIEAGSYIVAVFKQQVGVDASKELEQVVEGKLIPLTDDATIVLTKSGERFVSHVRRGGSS